MEEIVLGERLSNNQVGNFGTFIKNFFLFFFNFSGFYKNIVLFLDFSSLLSLYYLLYFFFRA